MKKQKNKLLTFAKLRNVFPPLYQLVQGHAPKRFTIAAAKSSPALKLLSPAAWPRGIQHSWNTKVPVSVASWKEFLSLSRMHLLGFQPYF